MKASDEDKKIVNPGFAAKQEQKIAGENNLNNSDIDFCEFNGKLIINYCWGDQLEIDFLAEAVYDGTLEEFLEGWFPNFEKVKN